MYTDSFIITTFKLKHFITCNILLTLGLPLNSRPNTLSIFPSELSQQLNPHRCATETRWKNMDLISIVWFWVKLATFNQFDLPWGNYQIFKCWFAWNYTLPSNCWQSFSFTFRLLLKFAANWDLPRRYAMLTKILKYTWRKTTIAHLLFYPTMHYLLKNTTELILFNSQVPNTHTKKLRN